jgi:hypothetical protein
MYVYVYICNKILCSSARPITSVTFHSTPTARSLFGLPNPPPPDIHPEDGNCSVCRNSGKPSAIDATFPEIRSYTYMMKVSTYFVVVKRYQNSFGDLSTDFNCYLRWFSRRAETIPDRRSNAQLWHGPREHRTCTCLSGDTTVFFLCEVTVYFLLPTY